MSERRSRGQIVFDDLTSDDFEVLVEQTLEESEFIEVENGIIYEVPGEGNEWDEFTDGEGPELL